MARGVADVNTAGTGPANWYASLPPITKYYATACFIVSAASSFELLDPRLLALDWRLIFKHFEIWRLFTHFFMIGGFSLKFVMRMVWILTYGVALESQTYQFDPAEYAFMYLFCGGCMLPLSFIALFARKAYGVSVIFVLIYVWSRNFPDQQVSLYGLFKIMSFYVPFAFVAIELMLGADIIPSIVGIACGHIWFFLTVLHPQASGTYVLKTPMWLKRWMASRGVGRPPEPTAAASPGFNAFRGSGRRLGTS